MINENILLKKRFWLAASIHKGEDIILFKNSSRIKKKFNDIVNNY